MPSCFVPGCRNNDKLKRGISYHAFPKLRKVEWLKAIGRDVDTFINQQRVCSEHFIESDYEKFGAIKKLNATAIPSVSLPQIAVLVPSTSRTPLATILEEPGGNTVENIPTHEAVREYIESLPQQFDTIPTGEWPISSAPPSPAVTAFHSSSESELGTSTFRKPTKRLLGGKRKRNASSESSTTTASRVKRPALSRSTSEKTKSSASLETKKRMIALFHNYSLSPDHYKKQIQCYKRKTQLYKKKFRNAVRTSLRRKLKVIHLKSIVQVLKKQSLMSTDALAVLENTFDDIPAALMKRMIANTRTKRGRCKLAYPPELKSFAMTLQFYNCKAYDYVRETFNFALPAQATLRAWFAKVECTPGISKPSIDLLQAAAEDYVNRNDKPLLLALLLDEMSIKKEIISEKTTQNVWGYVDFGADIQYCDKQEIATEALVLMVVAVNLDFKLPVAYFFINKLNGQEKANLVKETLHHLNVPNVKMLTLTCDGPKVHFTMMTELGCRVNHPDDFKLYFENPATGEKIYVLFDVCHMLKLVRNNWATAGVFLDPDGNEIKWDYIRRLHELQENYGLYLGNKLRKRHMDWQRAIMKVNLAAQTLSSSVADALEFLCNDLLLEDFQGVKPTIEFIRTFDQLFDLLNSRNPYGRGMNTPMKADNETYWRGFLERSVDYILHLTNTAGTPLYATTRKVPFLGFSISSLSLLQVYKDQVLETKYLKYILTYKCSQDHLELFFCSIRCLFYSYC